MPSLSQTISGLRAIVAVLAISLVSMMLPAAPAAAAASIGPGFFGFHDSNPVGTSAAGWPKAAVGSLRAWDVGVTWRNLEVAPGVFDFSRLDAVVNTARSKGADVLLVLGQTPTFHASQPGVAGIYGLGASSMPNLNAWSRYVTKVASRYKGKGVHYQVWNEANVIGFWNGSPAQMAQLTRVTDSVLRKADPKALLVAPALVTRLSSQRTWMDKFYAQRPPVSGYDYPVARYVDAVSLQLYPTAGGTPESSMSLLKLNRAILRKRGVTKPIWNTEVNYGAINWVTPAARISQSRQGAYVARTYLLNAANGIRRVYWYSWDLQNTANTEMTLSNGSTLSPGGVAFKVVRAWMVNSRVNYCARNRAGTYTCLISYAGGKKRVYWNPSRTVYVKTAGSATWWQGLGGAKHKVRGGKKLKIGFSPVMVRSRR